MRLQSLIRLPIADQQRFARRLGLAVALLCAALNWGIPGTLTLDWQHLYRPEDFQSWRQLWDFLAGLQTGISPFWSSIEVGCQLVLGTTWPISHLLYPLLIGVNAYWATTLLARNPWRSMAGAALAVIFAVAIRYIHKGNPQLYDMLMPTLLLSWLAALQRMREASGRSGILWAVLAGLCLSILELTRTLIFPLLPFLLVLSYLSIRPRPMAQVLAFLLPLLLLSGGWHLKQHLVHDQWHWSNHDGFNMQKSWADLAGPVDTTFHDDPPLYEGGFENINTDKHTAYNKVVRKQVREAIQRQPQAAAIHLSKQWVAFFRPKTTLFMAATPAWYNALYQPAVWLCAFCMLGILALAARRILARPLSGGNWLRLGEPPTVLAATTLLISAVFAVGEVGEEARFMISLLPLLATLATAVPGTQSWRK